MALIRNNEDANGISILTSSFLNNSVMDTAVNEHTKSALSSNSLSGSSTGFTGHANDTVVKGPANVLAIDARGQITVADNKQLIFEQLVKVVFVLKVSTGTLFPKLKNKENKT